VVVGGGLAGLAASLALADAGWRVTLLEKRPHLGGRATSYDLPNGEHVDNCQHVTMGCCTNLEDFYRRAGTAQQVHYYQRISFLDREGRRGRIASSWLPPPLHLAPSFLMFPSLGWRDKLAIARAIGEITLSGGRPPGSDRGVSMLAWLREKRQTETAIRRFWDTVLVSALDERLEKMDAAYGILVFWKGFLCHRRGFEIGIPVVPLAELYGGCRDAVTARGGEVHLRAGVRALRLADGACTGVVLEDGTVIAADACVLAVPHDAVGPLLPQELRDLPEFSGLAQLGVSPIVGVHLWYDRPVMQEPFLTLLDRTTQWVFNKTALSGGDAAGGQYLQLVISAAYDLVPHSRQEIIERCCGELAEVLPAARAAQLVKATVIKEVAATFSPAPLCDRWRPQAQIAVENLFLAGDWTRTGWPATMEGAVRSGYLAAEAVLAARGTPRRILVADLPPQGLARLFARV
jgi:zeta-carotene desaturase